MRTFKVALKSTFFSLLSYIETTPDAPTPVRLEQLRLAMLATLGPDGCALHTHVSRKLRFADDVKALWYARSELMAALAAMHGETWAHQAMDELDDLFRALLPKGMTTGVVRRPG